MTRIPVTHRPATIYVDGQPYDCCYMEYRDDRACSGEIAHSGKYVDMGPREGPPLPMAITLCEAHADCADDVFSEYPSTAEDAVRADSTYRRGQTKDKP